MKTFQKTILLTGMVLLVLGCSGINTNSQVSGAVTAEPANEDNYVKIPLSEITSTAKFYIFDYNGIKINYFAVLGSDNEARTALNACDVCGGKKGYEQTGNDMKCRNCGRFFSIDSLGSSNKGGGCWPAFLNHETEGDYILISKDELIGGAGFFA